MKNIVTIAISFVWLINGLFCKVLHLVPRHQQIVGRILGEEHSAIITTVIGISETLMFIWVLSRIKSRWCTAAQVILIATMNTIEFILAPDLLLFGRFNAVMAVLLIIVILLNEFVITSKSRERKPLIP